MRLSYILRIAWKALMTRKTRSVVTVGGIVIGVAAIVFLVSLGYGLQRLVTSEVTGLDAIRVIEVTSEKASVLAISDDTLTTFRAIDQVNAALPLASLAGKVKYQNASTDVVVFGATNEYMNLNGIRPDGGQFAGANGVAKEAIVNLSLLKVFGITDATAALGQSFDLDAVLSQTAAPALTQTETRTLGAFRIVGTLKDASSPILYIPLSELVAQGVQHYSQALVQTKSEKPVAEVRKAIEMLGFKTASVVDTIAQIDQVFAIFRIVLAAVGAIALVIAALGMFNTLTVSLLERTRELGFMKALGTQNRDVYLIFIAEAVVIAVTGGLVGILVGYYIGELINWILNIVARATNNPSADIFYTPLAFAGWVLAFSMLVGFLTGVFPARRAAKINPLDALRYE